MTTDPKEDDQCEAGDRFLSIMQRIAGAVNVSEIVREICAAYQLKRVYYSPGSEPMSRNADVNFSAQSSELLETEKVGVLRCFDPIRNLVKHVTTPLDWETIDVSLDEEIHELISKADLYGLGDRRVSFPLHHPRGPSGLLTLTSDVSITDWEANKRTWLHELSFIGTMLHDNYIQSQLRLNQYHLSLRERQALTMLASGYEIKQVADQFLRSQTTIRNDLKSASLKLGSANATQAATKAIVYGLIAVDDLDLGYNNLAHLR
jgi:DNA-binding CsgD family transcriptional regulator